MAGSNAIASGAAILSCNADGLVAGLNKAEQDVKKWGGKVQNSLANPGGKGGGAGGGMFGGLMGGAGKAGAVGMAIGVATSAVSDFGGAVKDTITDLDKMGAAGRAMGLTAEQFTGMAGVAKSVGEDTREFIESLVTMGKLGTDAANGTEQAAAAFKGLGIDANEFIKLRADEQFFQIFDALGKVNDPLQRTRFLMQAFGEDGGKYLLPLLDKAPDEIRAMAKEFAVSTEAMQKATAASQAWKRLSAAGSKLWQNIAVGFAPLMEGVANFAGRIMGFLQPAFDWLGRALGTVQQIGGIVWDFLGDGASELWGQVKGIAGELFGWMGTMPTVQEVVVAFFRATGIAAALAWDTVKLGAGAIAFVAGAIIEQGVNILGMFRRLVDLAKEVPDEMRPKWVDDMVGAIDSADDKFREFGGKMKNWGADAVTSWGKSAEQFEKWLDGKLAPKAKMAVAEGIKAGVDEGMKSSGGPVQLSGAVLKGSKEAYSLTLRNSLRGIGTKDEPIKGVLKETKKGNQLKKDGNKDLKKMAAKLESLGEV
jgi:hypothetical protein